MAKMGHIVSDVNMETPEIDAYEAAFAAELRAERARKQMTFDALERATEINKRTLMRLFDGERDLRSKQMMLICAALGVDPKEFVGRVEAVVKQVMENAPTE
jgi:transcriptional regulator with XRE-family HTH domain